MNDEFGTFYKIKIMDKNNRDFNKFLYNKYGNKKQFNDPVEENYFDLLNMKMIEKSNKRIDEIVKRIQNDVSKNNFKKFYQVKSFIEYKKIKEFVKTLNINGYEFLWCNSANDGEILKMNKLEKIIEGNYYCCQDCDTPMSFVNKKTQVIYCYFYKKILPNI